jgi:hypothetical protein
MKNFNKKLILSWNICQGTKREYAAHKIRNTTNINDCHYTKKLHQPEFRPLYSPSKITGVINEGGRDGHELKHMGDMENTTLVRRLEWEKLIRGFGTDGRILEK